MKDGKTPIRYTEPFLTMVFLFLVIGFLTTANTQFQSPLKEAFLAGAGGLGNTLATLTTFSWFLGYPVFGPIGSRWVDRRGYKAALLRGTTMMTGGLLLFFLSAQVVSDSHVTALRIGSAAIPAGFIVFILGSFVTGAAAVVLQVVINPYLSACDVPRTQPVQRLAIGGTANSIGTVLAPLAVAAIASGYLSEGGGRQSLPFACLAAVMAAVWLALRKSSLPDIADTRDGGDLGKSVWSFPQLTLGVVAIFFYVGVEVCVGANINMHAVEKGLDSPALLATLYWGGMLTGRAIGSTLRRVSPRMQLTVNAIAASVLVLAAMALDDPRLLAAVGFFHSTMWGAIFTLATDRLGKHTSAATGAFMIGVAGGAVFPLLQGALADGMGGWRLTWVVVLIGEAVIFLYAIGGSKLRGCRGTGNAALCIAILLTCLSCGTHRPLRVVVLYEDGGHHKAFTDAAVPWLRRAGEDNGFEVIEIRSPQPLERQGFVDSADVFLQLDYPPYMWSDKAKEAFERAIDGGGMGYVGLHHATLLGEFDGWPMWVWFSDFMGGIRYRDYIPELTDGTVMVEDGGHPVMRGVAQSFRIEDDEWYTYDRDPRQNADIHVIATVDEDSYTARPSVRMGDHPVIWTNTAKKARNVYFQFGHSPKLVCNKAFQTLMLNAIDYAGGRPVRKSRGGGVAAEPLGVNVSAVKPPRKAPKGRNIPAIANDPELARQIMESGLIHSPLPPDGLRSLAHEAGLKKVLFSETLDTQFVIAHPTVTGKRAVGPPSDPDYATYGTKTATLDLGGRDLEGYNRISFTVLPQCGGARTVNLTLGFVNGDLSPKEGYRNPTGDHLVSLTDFRRDTVHYEVADFRRDCARCLVFSVMQRESEPPAGDSCRYVISDIRLERVQDPTKVEGWLPEDGAIIYSTTGYSTNGRKTAIASAGRGGGKTGRGGGKFRIVEAEDGRCRFKAEAQAVSTTIGDFTVLDFSRFRKQGLYRITYGGTATQPFRIADRLWDDLSWKLLNFLFCQRCGHPVPGKHSACHSDVMAVHNGVSVPYSGGWHDAGDLSQQTLQTAETALCLFEAAQAAAPRNPTLAARLEEEALWGLDFTLRTRFGDGFRASSMGLLIWTDGKRGTFDDISSVRVQDNAFDNFLYAGIEAYASECLAERDPAYSRSLARMAEEDYGFAASKFARDGYDSFTQMYEHTYNTPHSLFQAAVSWSSSRLYSLTGDARYAVAALEAAAYMLDCQRTEPLDGWLAGFFYCDTTRRSIAHFIHQSREQLYMQSLDLLLSLQPDCPQRERWLQAVSLYGGYIKGLMKYTSPYGMIPAGVYGAEDYRDSANFHAVHIFAPQDAQLRFREQLRGGEPIDERHYVKRFPVWFNVFNGNNAVLLSSGKGAAIAARILGDAELREVAEEQLHWMVGKNPFGQSMVYGEGDRYPQMDWFSSGEATGAVPVGIRTDGEGDSPYWPQTNGACYREVWVTVGGKALSLIAEL